MHKIASFHGQKHRWIEYPSGYVFHIGDMWLSPERVHVFAQGRVVYVAERIMLGNATERMFESLLFYGNPSASSASMNDLIHTGDG